MQASRHPSLRGELGHLRVRPARVPGERVGLCVQVAEQANLGTVVGELVEDAEGQVEPRCLGVGAPIGPSSADQLVAGTLPTQSRHSL